MKLKSNTIPLYDFLNRNKVISIITHIIAAIFFYLIRSYNKLFAIREGNVVIISLTRLGDTLFSIPALRELKKYYDKKIIIICYKESIPIYNLAFSDLDYYVVKHEDFYFQERIAKKSVKKGIKSLKPEIIIDFTGTMASASIIYNLRAASITGINGKLFKQVYDNFVDFRIKPRLVDIYYDTISPIINVKNRDEMKTPLQVLKPEGKVLIHPFAGWKEKEWSFRNYIKLTDNLKNQYHLALLIPSGQISYDVLQEIEYAQIEVIQTSNVEDLIHNIQECTLFIGNDSGPANIANFVGRPTLTIYSATNPDYTATTNEHQIYLQKILNCSAGSNEKFCIIGGDLYNCPGIQCMNLVTFDQVHEQVISLLRKYCNRKNENSKVN